MGYARPEALEEALALLARGPATVLAGGTDLYPATTARELRGDVLDISAIAGLRGITRTDGGWRIGARTTWTEVVRADLPPAFDALKGAAREVGSVQIQNAGTVGGNLCNASPAADGVPPLMALDAEVELASAAGVRRMALSAFLTGPHRTARRADELLTAVLVPDRAGRSAFVKLGARRYLVISIVMVAAMVETEGDRIARAAISVGAGSAVAVRLGALEAALAGAPVDAPIPPDLVGAALSPIDDVRGSAGYRITAATELVRRAVAEAVT